MAGMKGRSGGARPGAGRKPKPPQVSVLPDPQKKPDGEPLPEDPGEFLRLVMLGKVVPSVAQLDAAKLLARLHGGPAVGKKQKLVDEAGKVAGKFITRPAPLKLVKAG